jgi:hypothetical protein
MRQERVSENRRFLVRDQASRQISASTPRGKVFEPTGASGPGLATKPSSDMDITRGGQVAPLEHAIEGDENGAAVLKSYLRQLPTRSCEVGEGN